ncbi:MAG: hypothetical protein JXR76_27490 [Deltaproteobacteria bacterium]|nr:hypothetical protein [Deltaproteobacteria bacterium]
MKFNAKPKRYSFKFPGICLVCFFLLSSCEQDLLNQIEIPYPSNDNSPNIDYDVIQLSIPKELASTNYFLRGKLVDYELIAEYPLETLQYLGAGLESLIRYGIQVYRVRYYTEYKGEIIEASGAIGIPLLPEGERAPITVYNHWTMYSAGDLPPSSGMDLVTLITTAYGNITFAPDYIGFGDSEDIFHPYCITTPTSDAIIDMIFAGRRFLFRERILPKFRLFMFGLSQGGHATVAAQHEIETHPLYKHRIHLTAVASGSGAYNTNDLLMTIAGASYYPAPSYVSMLLLAYNAHYNLGKNLDDIFRNSYGQLFLEMKTQDKDYFEIDAALPTDMNELLQDDYRANLIAGTDIFNQIARENSIPEDWAPKAPLMMCHSEADDMIAWSDAQNAYNNFIAAGSNSVQLVTLPPVDHFTSLTYDLFTIYPWFESLQ